MLRKLLIVLTVTLLAALPVLSQEADTEEEHTPLGWGLYAGYLMGDVLTEEKFGDDLQFEPTLDDDAIFGGLFWAEMNENWRFELRLTYMSATVLDNPPYEWFGPEPDGEARSVDMDIFYLDASFIRFFDLGEKVRIGIPFGVGWASAYADEPLSDFIFGRSINLQLEDGSGGMYFLGTQLVFEVGEDWEFFIDGRFRRFHRLTNVVERNAKTSEFTIGFSKQF